MRRMSAWLAVGLLLVLILALNQLRSCANLSGFAPEMAPPPPPPPPPPPTPQPIPERGGCGDDCTGDAPHSTAERDSVDRDYSGYTEQGAHQLPPPKVANAPSSTDAPGSADARDAKIAREVDGFRLFDVLFNQPTELPYNQQTLIRFVVASKDRAQAQAEFGDTTGAVKTDRAVFGRQVRAQLSGPGDDVQIQVIGSEIRDISTLANTTFDWYVTPKTTGNFKLTLRLYNRVFDDSQWVEVEGQPYVKEFQVKVSRSQRLEIMLSRISGWLALLGSSLVALLGIVVAKLRGRLAAKKPARKGRST